MRSIVKKSALFFGTLILSLGMSAAMPEIVKSALPLSVSSPSVIQGEPAQIIIDGVSTPTEISSLSVDGHMLAPFLYKGKTQGVYGVDINHPIGNFPIIVKTKNKQIATGTLVVLERKKPTSDFTIPEKLGGTTPEGEKNVISLLTKENKMLVNLWTNPKKLWTSTFTYPVKNPYITDVYGYNRDTGTTTITHKGVDFRATDGTPIYAINRGVVRMVKTFSIYGKTVIIDHGQGVMSFYMHLSKVSVAQGSLVQQGQKIGESGQSGYAEGEHLHLTLRVNNTSVDPIKFFALYGNPLPN